MNGVLVVALGLPPIIVTLATMSIWQGVALLVLPDPGGTVPRHLPGDADRRLFLARHRPGLARRAWILRHRLAAVTRFGLSLRAIGGDEPAAGMSGVRVRSTKITAYVLGGLLAALGGMYLATSMSSGSPTVGDGYILTSIAAVVIGGVPLTGGRGSPLAVVMGALILTITASLLYFADVSSFYQSLIDGVILLAVVGSAGAP